MFLVSGATGNVGGELVRALAGAGLPVRGGCPEGPPRSRWWVQSTRSAGLGL